MTDDLATLRNENELPAPLVSSAGEMVEARVDQGKSEPDFLGLSHTQAIPPKIIARISIVPNLPPMTVGWTWQSPGYTIVSVNHRAFISYIDHGRNDQSRSLQFTTNSLQAVFNFAPDVLGGTLICRCSVNWRRDSNGQTGTSPEGEAQFGILGDNPSKAEIRTVLAELPVQVIAYKESRFHQFDNVSLPLFGPPNGFGVMQLDTPRPSARQLWHWRDNVQAGITLYRQKQAEVNQHFQNIYNANPKAPHLNAEQLQLALYQYYNGGFYWNWDPVSHKWIPYGNTAYGDDAMRIEKLVKTGAPPSDWN